MPPPPLSPLLTAFIYAYLSERGIYPADYFQRRRGMDMFPNLLVQTTVNGELDAYVKQAVGKLDEWHDAGMVRCVSLVITRSNHNSNNWKETRILERMDMTIPSSPDAKTADEDEQITLAKRVLVRYSSHVESMNLPILPTDDVDFYLAICVDPKIGTSAVTQTTFRTLPVSFNSNDNSDAAQSISVQQQQKQPQPEPRSNVMYIDAGLVTLTITRNIL